MKLFKIHIPFILILIIQIKGLAQSYNFKNYNTNEGLPQSQVLSIYQDKNGNMWFGTNGGGLGKFNGNVFKTINKDNGLASNIIYSITENNKHELVFATDKGISVYDGLSFKNYSEKEGLKNEIIFKALADNDKVWIGSEKGVYILQNNKINQFNANDLLNKSSVYTIFIDIKKNIWFGTLENGVIHYNTKTKTFQNFSTVNKLMGNLIFSIDQNKKGNVLIGTQTGLNIINCQFKVSPFSAIPSNSNIAVSSLLNINDTQFYYGSYAEGLSVFDYSLNERTINYNLSNGLINNPILNLFKDREDNIWIGTDGSGVYKFKNQKFTYYTKNNGLPENYINCVSQDKLGNYWIAMRGSGLVKLAGNTMLSYRLNNKKPNELPDDNINAILPIENGEILFGTSDGLCVYENGKFRTIGESEYRHLYILSLYRDSEKTVWIGTTTGLFKYRNGIINEEQSIAKLKQEDVGLSIFSIIEDKDHSLLIGTEKGIIKLDKKSNITFFNKNNQFISSRVLSMVSDDTKNIWIGTDDGLYNYDYNLFTKISQKNGLHSNACNFLQIDNLNRLIIGQNTGIDMLTINDYYKKKITIQHLNKADGLLSLESNSNACFKDDKGRILIGTISGLEIYDPLYDSKNKIEALTKINSVKLFFGQENISKYITEFDSTVNLPKNLKLPFNKNHLTFDFVGVSLTAPEKVLYQYKLDGIDEYWNPASSKTEATYSSLPPGNYVFNVKAMNNDGIWNKEAVKFAFEILTPWYKTWWFYFICIVVLITSIIFYNRFKTKKLIADKQKLEKQVTERTKELRDEKEKVELINIEVLEQKSVIEHKSLEITDSIKYAKNIQEALLPNLGELNSLFTNSFLLYMPKDIVSGDFYWFAKSGDTRFIAAVDCTGHGVPGAFMSIVGNTLLNEIVNERKITIPGDILLELHKGVKIALNKNSKEFERRDGMDIVLCAFNKETNVFQYAGANRPLWIYRKNKDYELEIIKATKHPIGGIETEDNRIYENNTILVNEGDCLYLFSDGFADQFGGPKGKKYMISNLQKTFLSGVNLPMNEQKENLTQSFLNWKLETEQVDDVLVIGIKI